MGDPSSLARRLALAAAFAAAMTGALVGLSGAVFATFIGHPPSPLTLAVVILGMVCDPIGGFVEVPCVSRNGMFAVHAFVAAMMALAGTRCVVPFDDVVIAMRDIGRRMPRALKETAGGGLAQTPTGLRYPPLPVDVSNPK